MKQSMNTFSITLVWGVFLLLFPIAGLAQKSKDTLVLHLEKYPNGKISAYSYLLQSTGNGKAVCYDPSGKVMFQSEISRNHGHHSVYFKHHANKVVSEIEESSAPDGGIQWYRSYYSFNEKGELTGKREDNWDDRVTLKHDVPLEQPLQPEVAECAVIYSNVAWFINACPHPVEVRFHSRGESTVMRIAPGDTALLGNVIQAQFFQDPMQSAEAEFSSALKKKRDKKLQYEARFSTYVNESPTVRHYYHHIRAVLK